MRQRGGEGGKGPRAGLGMLVCCVARVRAVGGRPLGASSLFGTRPLRTHRAGAGARYASERQAWEHDRGDWERWRARAQEELDAARALAGLDARRGLAAQLEQAEARGVAERTALDK